MSPVIGPPECPIVMGLWRVRSPEIAVQLCPSVVVFQRRCEPAYSTLGFSGEKMIGYVHCQRSGISFAGSPEYIHGYGLTSRTWLVRRFSRVRNPPLFVPAKNTSGSFGSGAM